MADWGEIEYKSARAPRPGSNAPSTDWGEIEDHSRLTHSAAPGSVPPTRGPQNFPRETEEQKRKRLEREREAEERRARFEAWANRPVGPGSDYLKGAARGGVESGATTLGALGGAPYPADMPPGAGLGALLAGQDPTRVMSGGLPPEELHREMMNRSLSGELMQAAERVGIAPRIGDNPSQRFEIGRGGGRVAGETAQFTFPAAAYARTVRAPGRAGRFFSGQFMTPTARKGVPAAKPTFKHQAREGAKEVALGAGAGGGAVALGRGELGTALGSELAGGVAGTAAGVVGMSGMGLAGRTALGFLDHLKRSAAGSDKVMATLDAFGGRKLAGKLKQNREAFYSERGREEAAESLRRATPDYEGTRGHIESAMEIERRHPGARMTLPQATGSRSHQTILDDRVRRSSSFGDDLDKQMDASDSALFGELQREFPETPGGTRYVQKLVQDSVDGDVSSARAELDGIAESVLAKRRRVADEKTASADLAEGISALAQVTKARVDKLYEPFNRHGNKIQLLGARERLTKWLQLYTGRQSNVALRSIRDSKTISNAVSSELIEGSEVLTFADLKDARENINAALDLGNLTPTESGYLQALKSEIDLTLDDAMEGGKFIADFDTETLSELYKGARRFEEEAWEAANDVADTLETGQGRTAAQSADAPTPRAAGGATGVTDQSSQFRGKRIGESVTFQFARNTESAPDMGSMFGQDVEPSGRYMTELEVEPDKLPPGWESGEVTFNNPLYIEWGDGYSSEKNWKRVLSNKYDGATGRDLSERIAADGHDGIVVVKSDGHTSEIVDLTSFPTPRAAEGSRVPWSTSEGTPVERARAFDALPEDAEVTLFHATSEANAANILAGGKAEPKRQGRGIQARDDGIYVGTDPVSVEGMGPRILAVTVKKSQVSPSSEFLQGSPDGTAGRALVQGAATGGVVRGKPIRVEDVTDAGRHVTAAEATPPTPARTSVSDSDAMAAAQTQRGEPESVMHEITSTNNPGFPAVLSDLLEHVGDISNRAQQTQGIAVRNVREKVNKILAFDPKNDRLSIADDIERARYDNAEYKIFMQDPEFVRLDSRGADGEPVWRAEGFDRRSDVWDKFRRKYPREVIEREVARQREAEAEALSRYVKAHQDHNVASTEMGKLGKEMAIHLGRGEYDALVEKARVLDGLVSEYENLIAKGRRKEAEGLRLRSAPTPRAAEGADPPAYTTPETITDETFPLVGDTVDGRRVRGEYPPNEESVRSSLEDWRTLPGIREVPMSDTHGPLFGTTGRHYSSRGTDDIKELAEQIRASGEVSPLIVVVDDTGPYVLEGATRVEALHRLGAKSFPARVVVDKTKWASDTTPRAAAEATPPTPRIGEGDLPPGADPSLPVYVQPRGDAVLPYPEDALALWKISGNEDPGSLDPRRVQAWKEMGLVEEGVGGRLRITDEGADELQRWNDGAEYYPADPDESPTPRTDTNVRILENYRAANAAHGARKDVLAPKAPARIRRVTGVDVPPSQHVAAESQGRTLLGPGADARDRASHFVKMMAAARAEGGGIDSALDKGARDYLIASAYKQSGFDQGMPNPAALNKWREDHEAALSLFPDIDQHLRDVASASKYFDEATNEVNQRIAGYEKSVASSFANRPVEEAADAILKAPGRTSVEASSEILLRMQGHPDARAGLARALSERMLANAKKLSSSSATSVLEGGERVPNYVNMADMIDRHEEVLRFVWGNRRYENSREIVLALQRTAKRTGTRTTRDISDDDVRRKVTLISRWAQGPRDLLDRSEAIPFGERGVRLIDFVSEVLPNKYIEEVIEKALLDPKYALGLLERGDVLIRTEPFRPFRAWMGGLLSDALKETENE